MCRCEAHDCHVAKLPQSLRYATAIAPSQTETSSVMSTIISDPVATLFASISITVLAGVKFMTDDEAQSTGEFQMRHSHATHDLFNAIADGDFPKYDFSIQTMDPADEMSFDFDPLDCTKVILSPLPHLSLCTSLTLRQGKTAPRI